MSSREPSARPLSDRPTPRVQPGKTCLRAACGRYTIDIVPTTGSLLAVIGDGVGRPPVSARIGPAVVAAVLKLADTVDARTTWETQAWPLTA